jgi:hypothetical protein
VKAQFAVRGLAAAIEREIEAGRYAAGTYLESVADAGDEVVVRLGWVPPGTDRTDPANIGLDEVAEVRVRWDRFVPLCGVDLTGPLQDQCPEDLWRRFWATPAELAARRGLTPAPESRP